nr:MAG TPA: hypothetical protein [Caudoviricetes sp.]
MYVYQTLQLYNSLVVVLCQYSMFDNRTFLFTFLFYVV